MILLLCCQPEPALRYSMKCFPAAVYYRQVFLNLQAQLTVFVRTTTTQRNFYFSVTENESC